jgi:phosphoglycolate phosphatase
MNVLFDLDGTLTNPRSGFVRCVGHALNRLGRPVPDDDDLATFIGPPLEHTMRELLGAAHADLVGQAVAYYRERYGRDGIFENHLYPGISVALRELQGAGATLFVATSKPRVFATRITDHFGLTPRFRCVYGSELDGTRSVKADLVRHIIDVEDLEPATTVMVGDREHDIHGAKRNQLRSIGVLWGYGSREELEAAGADALCQEPVELPRLLDAR